MKTTRSAVQPLARCGFSLIELLVAIAIIAILLAMSVPAVTRARETAKKTQCLNHLRNLTFALTEFDEANRRLPASGNYFDAGSGGAPHHSWAVSILPWVDQAPLYQQWDLDKPITDPVNVPLTQIHIPVFVCPVDLSRSKDQQGDLSYVVNGGVGFTVRRGGVGDCAVDPGGMALDLNGNGVTCPADPSLDGTLSDDTLFKRMGLFFLENWERGPTVRHWALPDVHDGLSQTFLVSENVRAGYDPQDSQATFANPNPLRCAFYVGNPCRGGSCTAGNVDYAQCNAGASRINSGLASPEGQSPVPNSFHSGGVHMAFADGHVMFLSESIDGAVYAALASPQGRLLEGTLLQQGIVSGDSL